MGGAAGLDPVAMTKRRAVMRVSPAITSRALANRAAHHGDPHSFKALLRIVRRDGCDDAVDMGFDTREINVRKLRANAECGAGACGVGLFAGGDQGFGWHTAIVQTIATHFAFFNQHHVGAHLGGSRGNGQTARARADHANIGFHIRCGPCHESVCEAGLKNFW